MGQPVVHFEVVGSDGEKLRSYFSELFGWEFGETMGPTNLGLQVQNLINHDLEHLAEMHQVARRWEEHVRV